MRKLRADEFINIGGSKVPFVNGRIDLSETSTNLDDLDDLFNFKMI